MLRVDDYFNNFVRGPLDSDNTYIAEVLLRVADELQPSVFFREVQAGFVVSYQEPALSFCALSDDTESKKLSALLDIFYNSSAFSLPTPDCNDELTDCEEDFYDNIDDCKYVLDNCITDAVLSSVTSIPGDYYKKLPYNMQSSLDDFACPYDQFTTSSSVAQIYPVQDNTMTVTIWYNNQVSQHINFVVTTMHSSPVATIMFVFCYCILFPGNPCGGVSTECLPQHFPESSGGRWMDYLCLQPPLTQDPTNQGESYNCLVTLCLHACT